MLPRMMRRALAWLQGRSPVEGVEAPSQAESLGEYFGRPDPSKLTFRRWLWLRAFRWLGGPKKERTILDSAPPLEPFLSYQRRPGDLAGQYDGLHRGSFALNYVFGAHPLLLVALVTLFPPYP